MRPALALVLAALLASPSVAEARHDRDRSRPDSDHTRGGGDGNGRGHGGGPPAFSPAPAPGGRPYAPAPSSGRGSPRAWAAAPAESVSPAQYRGYAPAPDARVGTSGVVLAPAWWWGWGWGWGYYPLFPRPHAQQMTGEGADRIATTLSGGVAAMPDAVASGLALSIEGRTSGFQAGIDAIAVRSLSGDVALGSSSAFGWGTMHATWSIVSQDAFRLRLEAGGSMISMPAGGTSASMPWAGKVAFGPDIGVSGHVGFLGPIGFEGHARVTPMPVPVADTRAALALRGGALALTAGWRAIRVMGDGLDAPALRFSGPEIGLALIF